MRGFPGFVSVSVILCLGSVSAQAGPVFEIISNGSSAPLALISNWRFSSTGGGMVGKITLRDGFVLPTGGVTSFGVSDVTSVEYAHIQTPFTSGPSIPTFSFTAGRRV